MSQRIAAPALLKWSADFCTGLDVVDEQHQRLIDIFNALVVAQEQGGNAAMLLSSLHDLAQYTHYHFRTEAELMHAWPVNASHRATHLEAHRRFVEFLQHANALAATAPVDVADHVLAFLAQWLLNHIMGMDARMAQEIKVLSAGGTIADATALQTGTQDVLIDSMSALNNRLGERTFEVLALNQQLGAEIEQRKRTEHGLNRLQALQSALLIAGQMLLTATNDREMLHEMCRRLAECSVFTAVSVVKPGPDGKWAVLAADGQKIPADFYAGITCSENTTHPIGLAWRQRAMHVVNDILAEPALSSWSELLESTECLAVAAVPILREQKLFAILVLFTSTSDSFDQETLDLVRQIGDLLGHGLAELDLKASLAEESARQSYLARHDALTGLINRRALLEELPLALARARRNGHIVALGLLDVDDFKRINDNFGHEAGDLLLQEIAKRLKTTMRESDLFVRLGGDEFVIVAEDLDELRSQAQLEIILTRLHRTVETPFELGQGHQVEVAISVGIALSTRQTSDGEVLLREADAALYQAKSHKADPTLWWSLGEDTEVRLKSDRGFQPYGPDVTELLHKMHNSFGDLATQFVDQFYRELAQDEGPRAILANLTAEEMILLKARQIDHLQFLLSPDATEEKIAERARHVGMVHALVGVGGSLLTQSLSIYRNLLGLHLNSIPVTAQRRYWLSVTAEMRLQTDIQIELETAEKIIGEYFSSLSRPMPGAMALWPDASAAELETMRALPGIRCALVTRMDSHGILTVEHSVGLQAADINYFLQQADTSTPSCPTLPLGQNLVTLAWRTSRIQSTPSYAHDPRLKFCATHAEKLGIRSATAIPLLDEKGHVVACLCLLGSYPNQFESDWVREFSRGLKSRLQQIWRGCRVKKTTILPEDKAQLYRQQLFTGGLEMFAQPVVDLRTGKVTSVEALARLRLPDGSIVAPGSFMPVLGYSELDYIFREGLGQALKWLVAWDALGMALNVSINLSPSTLFNPECPNWVDNSLRQHGIAPRRLSIELLETETVDSTAQQELIEQLGSLGVKLAMDDLGSGYSSLERLSSLPFDIVKIDQSLVASMRENPMYVLSFIGALIQLGRDLDCDVVVEGLEDEAMVEAVAILGAPFGQGYGLARPMPSKAVPAWIRRFRLPAQSTRIRTTLGALAYHWQFKHLGNPHHPTKDLALCPLTQFLQAHAPQDSDAIKWHAQIHSETEVAEQASRLLMEWLVRQIHA